jgi:hypothetical protein
VRGTVTWTFLIGIIGLPYWIVLIPLHDLLLGDQLRRELAYSPALWFTLVRSPPVISGRHSTRAMTRCPTTS